MSGILFFIFASCEPLSTIQMVYFERKANQNKLSHLNHCRHANYYDFPYLVQICMKKKKKKKPEYDFDP